MGVANHLLTGMILQEGPWFWNKPTVYGSEILHQLSLVVYPSIYKVLCILRGCLGFWTINSSIPFISLANLKYFTNLDFPEIRSPISLTKLQHLGEIGRVSSL